MNCVAHADREASGICNYCGKSICSECAQELKGEMYCKECIALKGQGAQKQGHEPALAAFFSGIILGFGQIYNGQVGKGLLFFFNPIIVLAFASLLTYLWRNVSPAAGLVIFLCALIEILFVYIYGIRDAYVIAGKIKAGQMACNKKTGCLVAFVVGIGVMMMAVVGIAVLAAIAIPNMLRARIVANEAAAQSSVKRIVSGIAMYRMGNNGRFPRDESALLNANPPCLDRRYTLGPNNGYLINEVFRPEGYTITAMPLQCMRTGTKVFTATTDQEMISQPCRPESQEPDQYQED